MRFDQLYWADLPYVRESRPVETAMVKFRNQLLLAEAPQNDRKAWEDLSLSLISLSRTLRDETPPDPRRRTPADPPG